MNKFSIFEALLSLIGWWSVGAAGTVITAVILQHVGAGIILLELVGGIGWITIGIMIACNLVKGIVNET